MKILTTLFIIFFSSNIFASTEVVNKVFPATVLITAEDKNGQPQSLGSGFLVAPNIIATNFHVIENSYSGYVKFVNKDDIYEIEGVVGYDSAYDLALLKIGNNNGTPLTLTSPSVDIGQKVFAIGNPLGLEGTISDGIVSGLRELGDFSVLQISAPISPGNSGGPVVNENAEVIGVATFTFSEGQNINFAVPVKYVKQLLDNKTAEVSLSSLVNINTSYEKETSKNYDGVTISQIYYDTQSGRYGKDVIKFSIKNNLRKAVCEIQTIWIFYDGNQEPFDYKNMDYMTCIKSKLAKRKELLVDEEFANYLKDTNALKFENWTKNIFNFIEIRVLDYKIED